MAVFYKPKDGWVADAIPFYWEGKYHVFYLKDHRDEELHGIGTPWYHVATADGVRFEEFEEALPRGHRDEQDAFVYTGCVIEHEGEFHCFYTGFNPHFKRTGRPTQAVMHAVSVDLVHWTKDPAFLLLADRATYEENDWRDPFVFWNEESQEYWMLLAARLRTGPNLRRGCIALCTSADLVTWVSQGPFWAPSLYYTHECPDVFRIGDWWYLAYSTFSSETVTHYRMSRNLGGPWIAPPSDSYDGRAFYAAKTASDGSRVLVFGWNATRARSWQPLQSHSRDASGWQWGGSLVIHELRQRPDGTLAVLPPPEVEAQFTAQARVEVVDRIGNWARRGEAIAADVSDGFAWCSLGEMPDPVLFKARVRFQPSTRSCGLILRADDDLNRGYMIRIEPHRNRLVFDRWPRPGDEPLVIERPLDLQAADCDLKVFVEGSLMEVYANGEVALSMRGYDHRRGLAGLFVADGCAEFSGLEMLTID